MSNARKKKKRHTRVFLWLILLGLAACVVLSMTVLFPIVSVTVTGEMSAYSDAAVIEASGIKVDENLFSFSASRAEKNICTALPYIEKAQIKRRLSGEVSIECTESTNYLALPYEGGCLILNPMLKIVAKEESNSLKRAEIYGLTPANPRVGAVLEGDTEDSTTYLAYVVDATMEQELLAHVTAINVADKLNLTLLYEDRIYVMIGTASNIKDKFRMLAHVTSAELSATDTGYLDLSESGKATFKSGAYNVPEDYKTPAAVKNE